MLSELGGYGFNQIQDEELIDPSGPHHPLGDMDTDMGSLEEL